MYGSVEADVARGLALRMDHGSQYLSDHFLNQIKYWGICPSFGFVEEPETNGVAERWNRTLKEQAIYGRVFQNLDDVRAAVGDFVERYNQSWRLEKLAYRTPLRARNTATPCRGANVCPRLRYRHMLIGYARSRRHGSRRLAGHTSALIDEACGIQCPHAGEGPQAHPGPLRRALLPGAGRTDLGVSTSSSTTPSTNRTARAETARQPSGTDQRHVHGRGADNLAGLQRGIAPGQVSAGLERAPGRARSSHMTWALGDPVASEGWGSSQIAMVRRLTPHVQFIHVRQALVHPGGGHDRDGPAREPSDRRPPPGPARADPGGE